MTESERKKRIEGCFLIYHKAVLKIKRKNREGVFAMLNLEKYHVDEYDNYFLKLPNKNGILHLDWDSNSSYIRIYDGKEPNTICHINNLDNLISGLKSLRKVIKNKKGK